MSEIKSVKIYPGSLNGSLIIQPSKSFAHRALICAAFARGESIIENIHMSEDIKATIGALSAMGVADFDTASPLTVKVNGGKHTDSPGTLYCGESGSTLRFLIPLALINSCEYNFTGKGRLLSRPMEPYERICTGSGVLWKQTPDKITVKGPIKPGVYNLAGDISSQFISGMLFALPLLQGDSAINITSDLESKDYVELTVSVMKTYGIEIDWTQTNYINIKGGQKYNPCDYTVEADYSHAAFYLVAGAMGGSLSCGGLNHSSWQPDKAVISVLQKAGADISYNDGFFNVKKSEMKPFTADLSQCPDLACILAVLACSIKGTSRLENAGRLRFKESDRLHAMAVELENLGADVLEGKDFLEVRGTGSLKGGKCHTHADHRVAMALAVASTICTEPVYLDDGSVVSKSAPDFWNEFKNLGGKYDGRNMG